MVEAMSGITETDPLDKAPKLDMRRNSGWPGNFSTEIKAGFVV
jgi:hypothetical protein